MKSQALIATSLMLCLFGGSLAPALAATGPSFDPNVLLRAIGSGFRHIVPDGLDHMAFLLGLFFLSRNLATLVMQVTVFTLAHSLTMGLVVLKGIAVPVVCVEVAVGLSISMIGVEGLFPSLLKRWHQACVITVFGCVHGLAFAHHLAATPDIFLSPVAALFGFNLGVECGQLLVIACAFMVAGPWWQKSWYHARIAQPALCLIAIAGAGWAVHRLW